MNSSLHAITFRNKPLDNIIQPGEPLSIILSEKDNYIVLEMEKDNFNIKHGNINVVNNLKEILQEVTDKSSSSSLTSRVCNLSCNVLDCSWYRIIGRERMDIHAKTSKYNRCFLESPLISITGNEMNFIDCFLINPQILNIIGDCPKSDYKMIQIIFNEQPENPTFIAGQLDLKNNQTTKLLSFSNVKEITIEFNPQAWNN